jgi:hypothetical protein
MSDQVTTAFVKQFGATVDLKLQQDGSKVRSCVTEEPMHSEEQFFEQIGSTSANEVTTRHGDSPLNNTPHDRRRVTLRSFDWGDLIDKFDKVKMLIDPASPYVQNATKALGRCLDDVILGGGVSGESPITTYGDGSSGAILGVAYTGKAGATQQAFDTTNQVVAMNFGGTNVGLTVPKLIDARRIYRVAEVDLDMEELYIAVSAIQEANLLNSTPVTSADYAGVKALVNGNVDSFLGYTFKRTQRIPKTGSDWYVLSWVKSGIKLGVGADITAQIDRRADKRFSWYAYLMMMFGGVRMEEGKAVRIQCLNA